MGLPGAGKTTLAEKLRIYFEHYEKKVIWLNADRVRKEYNDWDFSHEGRIRQSHRMRELADKIECDFVICDFVAPLVGNAYPSLQVHMFVIVDVQNQPLLFVSMLDTALQGHFSLLG